MKGKLVVGQSWGALTVTTVGMKEYTRQYDNGVRETWDRPYYALRCMCGKVLEYWRDEWPGRKSIADCGCGAGREWLEKAITTLYLDRKLVEEIRRKAIQEGVSANQWMVRALRKEAGY